MTYNIKGNKNILIHCQYVYGIGHLIRTIEIAKELSRKFNVTIINGGEQVSSIDIPSYVNLIQLPAIYKNEDSQVLTPVNKMDNLKECFYKRRLIIEDFIKANTINLLITEHFPFGLLFKDEVELLITDLKRKNKDVKVVCSVRDIVESNNGSPSDDITYRVLNSMYDMLLIHNDENIVPFKNSFPLFCNIKIPTFNTGYVVRAMQKNIRSLKENILIVSIGGGRLGQELQESVINAQESLQKVWPHQLVIFLGAFQEEFFDGNLKNVQVLPFSQTEYDFFLSKASLLVCMGGYNTVLEAVAVNIPTLVYQRNFSGNNQEQACRISAFQDLGLLSILDSKDMSSDLFVEKILKTLKKPSKEKVSIDFNGTKKSTFLLEDLID